MNLVVTPGPLWLVTDHGLEGGVPLLQVGAALGHERCVLITTSLSSHLAATFRGRRSFWVDCWRHGATAGARLDPLRHGQIELNRGNDGGRARSLTVAAIQTIEVELRTRWADGPPALVVLWDRRHQLAWFAAEEGNPFFPMRRWFGGLTLRQPWSALGAALANRSSMRPFGEAGLDQLRRAPFVVTGRYHGACLAVLLEKPFLALATNSHMLIGLCEDAGVADAMVWDFDGLAPRAAELRRAPASRAAMTSGITNYLRAAAAYDRMFGAIAGLA